MSSGAVPAEAPAEGRKPDTATLVTSAVAAFLSLLAAIRYGLHPETVVIVFVIVTLVVISKHDLERHIIPNRIVVPAWIAVLFAHLILHPQHWVEWLVASFGAGAFFLVVQLVYPAGLGMGDVKLALLLGAALGWAVIAALLIGTLLAAGLVSAGLLVAHGAAARKRTIPLGPFLAGGAIVVLLFCLRGVQFVNERWAERPIVLLAYLNHTLPGESKGKGAECDCGLASFADCGGTRGSRGRPKPAADAQFISDLLAETQRHAAVPRDEEHSLRLRRDGRTGLRPADLGRACAARASRHASPGAAAVRGRGRLSESILCCTGVRRPVRLARRRAPVAAAATVTRVAAFSRSARGQPGGGGRPACWRGRYGRHS